MWMQIAAMTLVTVVATGCGGNGSTGQSSPAEKATPEPVTLAETCPQVEAALPNGGSPSWSAWADYTTELEAMQARGDTETQNALRSSVLISAARTLASDPQGLEFFDAREALRDGLDQMATRCNAAGSSALQ